MDSEQAKKTVFTVDETLCVGCGICVDACPMRILSLADGLCVLTDDLTCLECGTCIHECPKRALSIEESSFVQLSGKESPGTTAKGKIHFTPVLEELNTLIQQVHPVQVYTCEGRDVSAFDNFTLENEPCYARVYQADTIEKIGVAGMNFFGLMTANVLSIRPAHNYDLPMFIMDWDESEEHIFFICDLTPSDDPGRNIPYLTNYLYNPLEDLYQKYSTIPGLKNSVFHWVRATSSPYIISGTIRKKFQKSVDMILDCARDYLSAWLALSKTASPQDPDSDYMKRVHERRKTVRTLLQENDPGMGPLNKFLGKEKAHRIMSIVEP
jgi:NAD-dependent dihydropyrimidine dehydrogenase PreA subunit